MTIKKWSVIKEFTLFKKGLINISQTESIREKDNKSGIFYKFNFTPWVNVIALTPDDKMILVKQWRHGIAAMSIESPGGLTDPDETPFESAKRELREETGYTSKNWFYLGGIHPNPAIQTNTCHIFLAKNAKQTDKTDFDPDEELENMLIPQKEVFKMIKNAEISNAITLAAFSLFLNKKPEPLDL